MSRRRTGIARFVGKVLDETKTFADDILDRATDLEHDVRRAVSNSLRPEGRHDDRDKGEHRADFSAKASAVPGSPADLAEDKASA
ncbi:hypothetical protein [Streptomyces xanthochromogenes]